MSELLPAQEITVRGKKITWNAKPYIIAEMACGHQGRTKDAREIVDAAVAGGADCVQFEVFDPDNNVVPQCPTYQELRGLYFDPDQWTDLYKYARQFDIAISTFAYDMVGLELGLKLGSDLIKFNSSDLGMPDMLARVAEAKVPLSLGTGSSSMEEISRSVHYLLDRGFNEFFLMQGVQNFPTDVSNLHIRRMNLLRNNFGCLVGYADHTDSKDPFSRIVDLIAIGAGATAIEKHLIVERKNGGIDHQSAQNPDEFKDIVTMLNKGMVALGPARVQTPNESDKRYRKFQKKSLVAARAIPEGKVLDAEDVAFRRHNEEGISPMRADEFIGRKAKRAFEKFDLFTVGDFA